MCRRRVAVIISPARDLLSMKLSDNFTIKQLRNRSRYREMARFRSNQTLELTATRRAFTFQMAKSLLLRAERALGGGSSAYSR